MSGRLNHPVSQIIRQLLIDLNLASSSGSWKVFFSNFPEEKEDSICVYDTQGQLEGRHQDDGEVQERNGIQIRVRSLSHGIGYLKCHSIAQALDTEVRQTIVTVFDLVGTGSSQYRIQTLSRASEVIALGMETQTRRRSFTVNYLCNVRLQA